MYDALGITGGRSVLVAGIYNCVGPVANAIFIFLMLDRVGRRWPLILGGAGISICLICEAALNSQNQDGTKHGLSIGGVFFIFLVSVIFSFSFGPISWVYMSEIMPMQIRGRGTAFATGTGNWLVATFWAQVSPIALGSIDWKFYFIFIGFNILVSIPTVSVVHVRAMLKDYADDRSRSTSSSSRQNGSHLRRLIFCLVLALSERCRKT
jgi:MFS family permease